MNILIYVPYLGQDWGGIRQYAVALLRILADDSSNQYYVYHNAQDSEIMAVLGEHKHLKHVQDGYSVGDKIARRLITPLNKCRAAVKALASRLGWKLTMPFRYQLDALCARHGIDIVHVPFPLVPQCTTARLINTMHDVQELHFPGFFSAQERAHRAVANLDFSTRATKIVVSYAHVKADMEAFFCLTANKVKVVLLNMGKLWFEKFVDTEIEPVTFLKFKQPYLLYPANTWRHKNHIRLLEAVSLLKSQGVPVHVVFSGYLTDYYTAEILPVVQRLDLDAQVHFAGIVDEPKLYALYQSALGVVVPTLYEAGSFPLMESILMGIPVVCSNITSLPETIDNERFMFDPLVVADIARSVKLLWTDEEFRADSVVNSRRVSEALRKTNALAKFLNLYQEASATALD